jgi:hypothetical protein
MDPVIFPCQDPPHEPARQRDQPLSAAACRQSGRLAPVECRSAGPGPPGKPAHPALDRLFRLPLVPCDGPRVLRRSGHRRGNEPAVRQHQGRPRGAPGPRPHLPDRPSPDHAACRRLAADHVPDPRPAAALLCRHLFPGHRTPRVAGLQHRPGTRGRVLPRQHGNECREHGEQIRATLAQLDAGAGSYRAAALDAAPLADFRELIARQFDRECGGFGGRRSFRIRPRSSACCSTGAAQRMPTSPIPRRCSWLR